MLSGFADEENPTGWLERSPEMQAEYINDLRDAGAAVADALPQSVLKVLKYGNSYEGYWKAPDFLKQCDDALTLFESLHPGCEAVFVFDHSPVHKTRDPHALNAKAMNVGPDGKQPDMRDTYWLQFPDGPVQHIGKRGMREVLAERYERDGLPPLAANATRAVMEPILSSHADFAAQLQTTLLEERFTSTARGHVAMFLPKFHCELNPIEMMWCHSKRTTRAQCDYTFNGLLAAAPASLAVTSLGSRRCATFSPSFSAAVAPMLLRTDVALTWPASTALFCN